MPPVSVPPAMTAWKHHFLAVLWPWLLFKSSGYCLQLSGPESLFWLGIYEAPTGVSRRYKCNGYPRWKLTFRLEEKFGPNYQDTNDEPVDSLQPLCRANDGQTQRTPEPGPDALFDGGIQASQKYSWPCEVNKLLVYEGAR